MGVYFVTGGSSGIGYEIVCDLARLGHHVCAGYHSRRFPEDQLEEDLKKKKDRESLNSLSPFLFYL